MTSEPTYMFDTNVFNNDQKISTSLFIGRRVLSTEVQAGELMATRNEERRQSAVLFLRVQSGRSLSHRWEVIIKSRSDQCA
jgi:hypothetical protein